MSSLIPLQNCKYLVVEILHDNNLVLEKITLNSLNIRIESTENFVEILDFLLVFTGKIYVFDAKILYKIILKNYKMIEASTLNFLDISMAKSLSDLSTAQQIQKSFDNQAFGELIDILEKSLPERISMLWQSTESPLTYILAKVELNGVFINQRALIDIQTELSENIITLEISILDLLKTDLNINSTKQLGQALIQKGYKLGKKGKSGNISTDRAILETLLEDDEIGLIKQILEHRTYIKLHSGFVKPILDLLDKQTSRIHTTFDQTIVPTGRISSNSPNLQNIPIKNDIYGKKIRACFTAESGNLFVGADYSQAELRFLAHFTQDETLLEIFKSGQDVHIRTAAEIFEVAITEVTKSQRRVGKTLNFALLYQQGTFGTAKQLGITVKEAQGLIDRYFARFTKVKPFIEDTLFKAANDGYVETYSGRRRYFTNLKSSNYFLKTLDQRAAFNAVLQGSNADIIKLAMLGLENRFKQEGVNYKLVLQVHDELVIEVFKNDAEMAKKILKEEMELGQPLYVPLEVDVGIGNNWSELK
ncbi:MAG: hypothetical protein H7196_02075 [candidate division SR1 bacterium]|nr:hypothetical protein [candidate division SR1 bacterium]